MNPHAPHAPQGRSPRSKRSIHVPEPSQSAPDPSSDLALSHSLSPLSHSPLFEGTNGTLVPRRAALDALSVLFTLQIAPEPSSDLSPSPLSHLSSGVMMNPQAPLAPQGRSQRSERSIRAPDRSSSLW